MLKIAMCALLVSAGNCAAQQGLLVQGFSGGSIVCSTTPCPVTKPKCMIAVYRDGSITASQECALVVDLDIKAKSGDVTLTMTGK